MNAEVPILPVVQMSDRVFVKRDDLYDPFGDGLNGAKVYQIQNVFATFVAEIREKFENTIFADSFISSPFLPITARVAKEFGVRCIIPVGSRAPENVLKRHKTMRLAASFGAEVVVVSKAGHQVKNEALARWGERYFRMIFGDKTDSLEMREAAVAPVRRQVEAFEGLPTETMTLIVPMGSGMVFSGLLLGLAEHRIRFKRIVGVQISGLDRKELVESTIAGAGLAVEGSVQALLDGEGAPVVPTFEIKLDRRFPFYKFIRRKIGDLELDCQYEAKAWDYSRRNGLLKGPVLFYVVGNSNSLR